MSGLLRRLTRRRAATADETRPETPAASEPVDASASTSAQPGGEEPVRADEQPTAAHDLPAGMDPGDLAAAPGEGARPGSLRRRARYLRAAREVLLRDLGGFAYEIQRTAGGAADDTARRLLEQKAARLAAIDGELRELERRLGEPRPALTEVRQPGIGGTCPECGELHSSEAAFCWRCGTRLPGQAARARAAARAPRTGSHGITPAPAAGSDQPTAARLALWLKASPTTPPEGQPAAGGEAEGGGPAGGGEAARSEPAGGGEAARSGPPAGAEPAGTGPAAGAEPSADASGEGAPSDAPAAPKKRAAKRAPKKPAAQDVAADERPAAVERPGELSQGDPLATPAERRP